MGGDEDGDSLLALKAEDAKVWMMVTNSRGELVPKSLLKLCKQREVLVEDPSDTLALLRALVCRLREGKGEVAAAAAERKPAEQQGSNCTLQDALDEGWLQASFRELNSGTAAQEGRLSFEDWLRWDWLKDKVGPPGSSAIITPAAAEEIWSRVVPTAGGAAGVEVAGAEADEKGFAGMNEFAELAKVIVSECRRATAIQSVLRGCAGRRKAETAKAGAEEGRLADAEKLAPFNPTPECAIAQALDALGVGPSDLLYDLGCGDGRLLLAAAARGARAVGVEYDRRFADRAREAAREAGVEDLVQVLHADACGVDLSPATKVFVYLVPSGLRLLAPALAEVLRKGVPVASYTFSLPDEEPDEVLIAETRAPECKVWIYRWRAASPRERQRQC